ncbi:acetolactate synthase large subunit [Nereida sp. MMG025]|uniref:acetolactate synthase large subunit n=1 Tax=Nereida sp. MMG025 TaxID=2909981 RepID=UPI001F00D80A|nr:acetolactate synthase large subunit [Nereida sp. MMG025]MCF6445849.1 acetolactate synthase large subunit [Nereida sp. MMG025]
MSVEKTGAQLFIGCLETAGIDTIYGVPGEENTDVMLAIEASDIRFVLTRHEQAAAFMASVYGRLTGRPAACLSTLGPGATNLLTGVADATLDFAPLVAITAQADRSRAFLSESHQVIDLEALFQPVTKASHTLTNASAMAGVIAQAVRLTTAPRPGAVHLSLPEDLAKQTVNHTPLPQPDTPDPLPAPQAVLAAIAQIKQASRPLIMAGNGVIRANASDMLTYLAESLNIPVATSFMASGILPKDHPLNLFCVGQPFRDHIDTALEDADLIIAIGFDPIEYPPQALTDGGRIPVVALNAAPLGADVGWSLGAEIIGGLGASLKAIAAGLDGHEWDLAPAAKQARAAMLDDLTTSRTNTDDTTFYAEDILRTVETTLTAQDTVFSGVGTHKMKVARSLIPKRAGQIIIANGLAGMGLALPGAIAAADLLRDKDGHVLAICGDGDVMMNIQDMETATRLGTPLTVMVWEDGGYGLIKAKQEDEADTHTPLAFGNPDWADLARAFAWHHLPVTRFGDLSDALANARAHDGPVLMTLQVRYDDPLRDRA